MMPGVTTMGEGAWAELDEAESIDKAGNTNTLSGQVPTGPGHQRLELLHRRGGQERPGADSGCQVGASHRIRETVRRPWNGQLGFHLDTSACIGCKACQVACKDKNDLPVGVNWRRVIEYGGGGWRPEGGLMVPVGVFAYHVSLSCMHCEDAGLPASLPRGGHPQAGGRRRSPWTATRCLGCHYCEWACPYGAPQFGLGCSMSKCNFCEDLQSLGQNPVCVDACPTRALHWGNLEALASLYGDYLRDRVN